MEFFPYVKHNMTYWKLCAVICIDTKPCNRYAFSDPLSTSISNYLSSNELLVSTFRENIRIFHSDNSKNYYKTERGIP